MEREPSAQGTRRAFISIRWIATGAVVGLTVIAVLSVWALGDRFARRALTRSLATHVLLEARALALASGGVGNGASPERRLHRLLAQRDDRQAELAIAVVLDSRRRVLAHADSAMIGERYVMPMGMRRLEIPIALEPHERLLVNDELLIAMSPLPATADGPTGDAVVAGRLDRVDAVIEAAREEQRVLASAILAGGVVASTLLMAYLLRPVKALRAALERFGRGDLETPVVINDRTEFGMLAETMNAMSSRIRSVQREVLERERLAHELELAREMHAKLLPSGTVRAGSFVIEGMHRAASEVGGDYYDVATLPDGRVSLAVADVSASGLGGCIVTYMLAALLRAFRHDEESPSSLLMRLEDHLIPSMQPGTFVTMFYGVLEPATGRLRYASAGHSPTLVYRAATGDTHWIHSGGIPLGAVRGGALGATLRDQHIVLGQGDLLVQFTDGVNEALAADASGPFGFDRLAETVATLVPGGGREVITGIQAALAQWTGGDSPHDDETLLVVSREAVPRDRPTTPESGLSCGDGRTALGALARARRSGHALNLNASIDALPTIRQWIDTCPALRDLGAHELVVLESGLYELCANIIEHGYRERDTETLTLWWLPSPAITPGARHVDRPGLANRGEDGQISDGLFVILDRGRPFGIDDGAPGGSPDARRGRRGRGLGLGIIRNAMRFVRYHPGTEAGNITLAGFDPGQTPGQRTARPGVMSS